MREILALAKGNPGAINALMNMASNPTPETVDVIETIQKSTIRGTDIYILFNDLCHGDTDKVIKLCKDCPIDVLQDACSRQDRSGVGLVSQYLN